MLSFHLSIAALESIATLHHATPATKDARQMTPILTAIQLTVTAERWTAVATDHYLVAELTDPITDEHHTLRTEAPLTLQLASTDLVALAKAAKPHVRDVASNAPVIRFTADPDTPDIVTVDVFGLTLMQLRTVAGNYPRVARIFPDETRLTETALVSFDPAKLARIAKIASPAFLATRPAARAGAPIMVRFTKAGADSDKPGPMFITRPGDDGFRAMLQPTLPPK